MSGVIVFDLDGTLVDSEFNIARITADLAQSEQCNLDIRTAFCTFGGMSFKDRFNTIAKTFDREFSPERLQELHEEYTARKEAMYANPNIPMISGARGLLERLSKHPANFTLALGSSNVTDRSKKVLQNTGLSRYFGERVFGSDLVDGRKKPDPAIHNAALSGYDPEKSVIVEDSVPGVMAARSAGAFVVAYLDPRGARCENRRREYMEAGADVLITNYSQFEYQVKKHWDHWPTLMAQKVA